MTVQFSASMHFAAFENCQYFAEIQIFIFEKILCFTFFQHSKKITANAPCQDKFYLFKAGKLTVCEQIIETNAFGNSGFYHFNKHFCFCLKIFIFMLFAFQFSATFFIVTRFLLLFRQSVWFVIPI
jgi:hypothetical protein